MTEKIIKKEDVEYKLTCSLFMEWNRPAKYRFKLQQRECGKREWLDLKGEEYLVYTEKDIVLQYVSKEDVLELTFEEYKKYYPNNEMKTLIFDVMLNERYIHTFKYKYNPLFPIEEEKLRKFVEERLPTLKRKKFKILF